MTPRATLLVPAWNEGAVIARTLAPLAGAPLQIVVIANACSDDTGAQARAAAPGALVLETPVAGKTRALNLGFAQALPGLPVVCLDADLRTTAADVLSLVAALEVPEDSAEGACGRMQIDATEASAAVRAYMRAWATGPYLTGGKFGGLFALSFAAAARLFPLPEVTADDEWIRRSLAQIAFVPQASFTAMAPRDLPSLIRVRRRSRRGTAELDRAGRHSPRSGAAAAMLRAALPHPGRVLDLGVYAAVSALVRLQLAARPSAKAAWERDASTRPARTAP